MKNVFIYKKERDRIEGGHIYIEHLTSTQIFCCMKGSTNKDNFKR
jgi:hypothetical protein